ncbi:thiolase family protein [Lederbergia lenta]|uniref:Beta-ketothiolase n=1 Tax=Lederbergia lenta TaxID=1467 RepID=A0A2X4WZ99_LEDLE|nr:thiolase family protein [Lederbergia lenta]MCM3112779.1 thiolase family protein [Lederbergia lenta]MEC2326254.1 thiolase family protein [Lederbergia lenta]SQI63752.1 beta-ketothiolase [Lederbergia lenta]
MAEVVIIEAVRTPIGRKNGALSSIRPDELLALVLKEIINRTGMDPSIIDDVIAGCVTQVKEQAGDIARIASLIAGFPQEVPGITLDRQCGSSQQAVHFASQAILSGDMDVVIACGVESMSQVPMFSNVQGAKHSEILTKKYEIINQGLSAERIAEKWGFTRKELDQFSLQSHKKAIAAMKEGRFDREIMPVMIGNSNIQKDEGPRENTSMEILAGLEPPFLKNGNVTAGNASQISDGASAILLMSKEKAEKLNLKARFRVVARSVVGSDPTLMLTGPVSATEKVLKKANMDLSAIDLFEINEAFASVPLFWLKETGADPKKLNVNGGAIALGHPLGATGARVMTTLLHELERTEKRFGLQAICEGFGMANATIIERLN